jgi:hypothetical protein
MAGIGGGDGVEGERANARGFGPVIGVRFAQGCDIQGGVL